ncbi:histone-lysine N-methyltransferase, H3 lysine-79 specific-like [Aethina tumida]|uniref:histone-lysine N-methyltransferase, H3 lysine-79 specific-like n=1 Tax=Aethina tumida TaxID=116153 RepID=UPI002148AD1A|nr:histone-lysine N-methyltransferase, H3 lysine-79 specific-like [Aethina tumida]
MINAGKGREAMDLFVKKFRDDKIDVGLVQEGYHGGIKVEGYNTYRSRNGKVDILIKSTGIIYRMNEKWIGKSGVMICLDGGGTKIWVLNIFDEPQRTERERESKWDQEVRKIIGKEGIHIIAGDLNAKNETWCEMVNNARGRRLQDWIIENGYNIVESEGGEPTFKNAMEESWIDLVIARGTEIGKLRVLQEETLSDHEYLKWEVMTDTEKKKKKQYWDVKRANWEEFRKEIRKWIDNEEEQLTERVKQMQTWTVRACKKALKIKKDNKERQEWWNAQLEERRRRTRNKRREYQNERERTQREVKKREFLTELKGFRKEIKEAKLKQIEKELEEFKEDPWGKAYKLVKKNRKAIIEIETGDEEESKEDREKGLVKKYFPKRVIKEDYLIRETEESTENRKFTRNEMKRVIKNMKKGKATGEDRIPNECLEILEEEKGMFKYLQQM